MNSNGTKNIYQIEKEASEIHSSIFILFCRPKYINIGKKVSVL
jgi:hypothetical protein